MLILVPKITGRVVYIFELTLNNLLGIDFELTTDVAKFKAFEGPKLHYAPESLGQAAYVKATNLLFERHLHEQELRCVDFEGTVAPYAIDAEDSLLPFDVFSASFFLVTRYEEYLSRERDQYGRFKAEHSWMYQNNMLQKPLVNIWIQALGERLRRIYPDLVFKKRKFEFVPTYDIDAAWAYLHTGF